MDIGFERRSLLRVVMIGRYRGTWRCVNGKEYGEVLMVRGIDRR